MKTPSNVLSSGVRSNPKGVSQTALITAIQRVSHKIRNEHFMVPWIHNNVYDSWHKIFPLVSTHITVYICDYMDWVLRHSA